MPELGHGIARDDLIVLQLSDKAQCLELTLPLLQLPQDQGPEDLHVLRWEGRRMGNQPGGDGGALPVSPALGPAQP